MIEAGEPKTIRRWDTIPCVVEKPENDENNFFLLPAPEERILGVKVWIMEQTALQWPGPGSTRIYTLFSHFVNVELGLLFSRTPLVNTFQTVQCRAARCCYCYSWTLVFLYFSLIISTSEPQCTVQQHSLVTVELGILKTPHETKKSSCLNPPISTQMSLVSINRTKLIQSHSLALFGLTWKNTPINHIWKAAKREKICSSLGSSFCSFFGRTNFYYQTQNAQLCVDSSQLLWFWPQ